jgi:hypothetical protein
MIQKRTTLIVVQNASRCLGDKTRHDRKGKVYLSSIDATQENDPVIPFAFPASDPFINALPRPDDVEPIPSFRPVVSTVHAKT